MGVLAQYWQTLRPLRHVKKLRGSFTIPTFNIPIRPTKHTLIVPADVSATVGRVNGANLHIANNLTVEFWFKYYSSTYTRLLRQVDATTEALGWSVIVDANNNLLTVTVETAFGTLISTAQVAPNEWTHVAFTFNNPAGLIVYINGESTNFSVIPAANIINVTNGMLMLGNDNNDIVVGYLYQISELRIWNVARTPVQIGYYWNKQVWNGSAGLVGYWKLSEGSGLTLFDDTTNNYDMTISAAYTWTVDYISILNLNVGISYVIGYFALDTGKTFSINFPVVKPYIDVNFMPVVRWSTTEGIVTRYKLWEHTQVDIAPIPPTYNGEAIPDDAVIEIWNIDGEETVQLDEVLTILSSILNVVTSSRDVTRTASATISSSPNTVLFSNLPAAVPIVFNQPFTI